MIRILSKRSGSPLPSSGEIIIDVDRSNPVLGNPYILQNPNDSMERDLVINKFKRDFIADCKNGGPMLLECQRIAGLLISGKSVALMCWCSPNHVMATSF